MPEISALETGLYTLTPTHCGTGQAAGAIDLPIARERHTDFPVVPASSIKGVLRELAEGKRKGAAWTKDQRKNLLGTDPPGENGSEEPITGGRLVLTDGRLLAFPVRSLQAPFVWVTCPLVIGRWERDRRALGLEDPAIAGALPEELPAASGAAFGAGSLVLEDRFYSQVVWKNQAVEKLARHWCRLLPGKEAATRSNLATRLVCVRDQDFQDLVRRTTPVNARIQLTGGKTTDTWKNPDTGETESGNLWYEETLPSDCLLSVLITSRHRSAEDLATLRKLLDDPAHQVVQVGGNETVGQGLCWWRPEEGVRS